MSQTGLYTLALAFSLTLFAVSLSAAQQTGRRGGGSSNNKSAPAPEVSFTVGMPEPHTHMLEVEMRVRFASPPAPQVNLRMPVWTPGSYLVREFSRNVQDFAVKNTSGQELAWSKTGKDTWRVETNGARELRAAYRVYANELSVRTNELNDRHAFWNNAGLLMYVDGSLDIPATVTVAPYRNWKIATGLPAVEGNRNTFRAENFDVLYDSPFLLSDFRELRFEVRGVPHRVVIDGAGNYDAERVRRDVQKIVETAIELMGGEIPYRDYTFLLMLHPAAGGGLEHLNSTALLFKRFGFSPDSDYKDFLTLIAHEYFHLWNVKRIRPDALGPFDYTRENYTKLLWFAEGGTAYYENVIVRRANLLSAREYMSDLAKSFQTLQETPGRLEQSLEEASFDAWIKYYRRDENSLNSQVSYYEKGSIVTLLLDLEIRRRSVGARSLDDVMRHLYTEFAKRGRNYTPEDLQRTSERMAGASLEDFFSRYVRGRAELDYNTALEAAGLRLDTSGKENDSSKSPAIKAFLGATLAKPEEVLNVTTTQSSGFFRTSLPPDALVVKNVPAGTPASNSGLNSGDQILALDGLRVTRDTFDKRLEERQPGDQITLTVFRLDELRTFNVKLGGKPLVPFRLLPVARPTVQQQRIYEDWLRSPYSAERAIQTQLVTP